MFDINKCTFDTLNNVTRDNDSNIVLVHIPVSELCAGQVDNYIINAIDVIKSITVLKDYEIFGMPYVNDSNKIKFTKLQEQELNALGWFKENK